MLIRPFIPPGPVAARFLAGRDPVGGIMGPVGSAKTSTALVKRLYIAAEQKPWTDGVRRTKHVVIRTTTRELEKTTIPTWLEWVPRELGSFTGGSGGVSARHQLQFAMPDGSRVDTLVEFVGLNDHKIEDVMRGYEGTTAVSDEADLLSPEAHEWVGSRLGRHPKMDQGGPTYYGQDLMFNAPDTENYCYTHFLEEPRAGYVFYRQPGGLLRVGNQLVPNPQAENLHNLPPGYYQRLARGMPAWMLRRLILNEFGYSRAGEPVYPEYDDQQNVAAAPLEPIDAPLILGGDQGLQGAVVVLQRNSFGQILVLDEVCSPPEGQGAELLGERVRALLQSPRYQGLRDVVGFGDPAGDSRKDVGSDTWLKVIERVTKVRWRKAMTNNPDLRQEAVRQPLVRMVMVNGALQRGLIISPHLKNLRKGFNGGYRLKRIKGADGRISEDPDKNYFSNVHDALQYGCLGAGEGRAALYGRDGGARRKQVEAITDDNPDGSFAGHGRRQAFAETD
jgi:hypothetical protein